MKLTYLKTKPERPGTCRENRSEKINPRDHGKYIR